MYPKWDEDDINSENSDWSRKEFSIRRLQNIAMTTDPNFSDTTSELFKEQSKFNNQQTPTKNNYKIVVREFDNNVSDFKEIIFNTSVKDREITNESDLLLSEILIKNVTLQAYFDDPLLPYRMREVIVK